MDSFNNSFKKKDYMTMSIDFIKENTDTLDWYKISKHSKLSTNFIVEYADYLEMHIICRFQYITEDLFEYRDLLPLLYPHLIVEYQTHISDDSLFKLLLNFKEFYYTENYDEEITENYFEGISILFLKRKLSESFLFKFIEYFKNLIKIEENYFYVMYHTQTLSFNIMKKYADYLNWDYITEFQTHIDNNDDFVFEMKDYINSEIYNERNFYRPVSEYTPELYEKLFKFRDFIDNWNYLSKTLILLPKYFVDETSEKSKLLKKTTPFYHTIYKERLNKIINLQNYINKYLYKPYGKMYTKHEKHFYSIR